MPLELKKSPYLFAYAAFLVAVAALLVWQKVMTQREASALVVGALAFPAMIGAADKKKNDKDNGNGDGGVTVPTDPPASHAFGSTLPPQRQEPPTQRDMTLFCARVWASMALLALVAACAGASDAEKKRAAGDTYVGAHAKCASTEPTAAAIDACRAKVRAEWNVPQPDGGAR